MVIPNKMMRRGVPLAVLFLLAEFLDEFIYAAGGVVLPSLRQEFQLSYAQVGLLLGLPQLANTLLEPAIMLLGDTRCRKLVILAGGAAFAGGAAAFGLAPTFGILLAVEIFSAPASAAFVSLSQATLMEAHGDRQVHWMARWSLAGSLGSLAGPLLLAGGLALGLGWRWVYLGLGAAFLILTLRLASRPFPARAGQANLAEELREVGRGALAAMRNVRLLRWLALMELSDLMLDIFSSYLALYLTAQAGLSAAWAGAVFGAYVGVSLLADMLFVWLVERVAARHVVRATAILMLAVYPVWLLVPSQAAKVGLLALLPFCRMGWYATLEGAAYQELPGRGGTVKAVGALGGLLGAGLVWLVGWLAQLAGLQAAMWLLLLGPLSLVLLLPKK